MVTLFVLFSNFICILLATFKTLIQFIINTKVRLSAFLKYRFYGITKNVNFPKPFETFIFNWVRVVNPAKTNRVTVYINESVCSYLFTNFSSTTSFNPFLYRLRLWVQNFYLFSLQTYKSTCGDGFLYIRGLVVIFSVDALIADDEPIWEPVEWSLVQSWILFIFLFAWIAENLICSRYGSYTGRDKRVWFAWYKTYWFIELWYILSMGAASLWVMVPHYYEVTYGVSFIFSWWSWYSRVFFFKFISVYAIILFLAYFLQITMRWTNWKKSFYIILFINFFLGYLLYTQFFLSFFGYFTDPRWYSKTRLVDYVQLSHEPSRWGWGDIKRDHFTHHRSKTAFWFKSDGPFASAFLFYNLMFFLSLFTLYFYWIALIRRVYVTQEITFTYTTYCISGLKQFFYFFGFMLFLVCLSYVFIYWRLPNEFLWTLNPVSWFDNFITIFISYPSFILSIFF